MSDYVDRVTFVLHSDFADPQRTLYKPPYETTVLGQIACAAYIYVYFRDATIQPCFFTVPVGFTEGQWYQKEVKLDNMIFVRPTLDFYKQLQIVRPCERYSGLLHHIQPDLFKQLFPKARCVELKPNIKFEDARKALEETEGEGVGVYVIEQPKKEEGAERVVERYAK